MTQPVDYAGLVQIKPAVGPALIYIEVTDGLSPELARSIAQQLIAAANECERRKPLRRPVAVEEQLRGLDG